MVKSEGYDIGESIILNDTIISNNIYIDFAFMKYIELGRVLASENMTEDQYTAIRKIVTDSSFRSRHTDDIEVIFESVPNLSIIQNSSMGDIYTVMMAPTFEDAHSSILSHLANSREFKLMTKDNSNICITLDISKVSNITDSLKAIIVSEYVKIFGSRVELSVIDFKEMGEKASSFDAYFISDLASFNAHFLDKLNNREMMDKWIFCRRSLPLAKLPDVKQEEISQIFGGIELFMTAAANFKYIDMAPCLT